MLVFFASPFLLCPLQLPRKNKLVKFRNFFLTFSDALLCLIGAYKIKKTDIILMPNFYCPSTLKTISQYFDVKFYKINDDFSVDKEDYFSKIREFKPRAILNYAYLGFTLNPDEINRLKALCAPETIIINDAAHKILDESGISFIGSHHFYINSCRKHSAFLGSHLINPGFSYSSKNVDRISWYKIKLTLSQYCEELLNLLTALFSSRFLYQLSEKVFLYGDSIAGHSKRSTRGNLIDYFLYNFLSFKTIRSHNRDITLYYNETFRSLNNPQIKALSPAVAASAEPNYFPLMVEPKHQKELVDNLKKNKIFADVLWESHELPDEFKAQMNLYLYDSLIVFPITWLIKKKHIDRIASVVKNTFKSSF